ncbi:MAG: IS21-like element helper ATPase IstB [Deltaproteobacteria bacterium]|nr:IS21-like element helper ATPase IstB [Deltaproteobacteria bacterium]
MVDNLKSAVLKRTLGRAPVFNPKYLDFANHYGFDIAPCNVGRGNEKGRVENAVGYVKKNFLAGLNIADFAALTPAARLWTDTVANVRIHDETRKKPVELFENERSCLSALPVNRFDVATVSQIRASSQFRISVDGNRYSVPAEHAGAALTLKTYPERLCIYREDKLIARHERIYGRGEDIEDPDHPKALLAQRKKARDQKIFMRFLALTPKAALRRDHSIRRRIGQARFPVLKTLDQFNWSWPKKINRLQVKNLFRLQFVADKSNVIFLGGVGLGKSHLAAALGYQACLKGHSVLFATAVDVINTLAAAQAAGRLKQELKKYIRPSLLVLDELGFLPIDKAGADLLFQVISLRYEQGALVITSNRAFKDWVEIFNNDSTLTSAILDRLLHHAETVIIEGMSYRMKDKIES